VACNDGNSATGGTCYEGKCVSYLAECQGLPALGFPGMGMTTCTSQAQFNNGKYCGVLWCGVNNNMSTCTSSTLLSGAQVMMWDGVSCGASSQCVGGACVASSTLTTPAVYAFQTGPWTTCSAACAGGTQTRVVTCEDQVGRPFPDGSCTGAKPATSQACNTMACPRYAWVPSAFGACSAPCAGGTQTRTASCVDQTSMTTVADSLCTLPKPVLQQACNTTACSYAWTAGAFSACSVTCGDGAQTRAVSCVEQTSMTTVADLLCVGAKPDSQQPCTAECVDAGMGGGGASGCGCGVAPSAELLVAGVLLLLRRRRAWRE
jgi:uncharacterized protein (TIGR03382 family)